MSQEIRFIKNGRGDGGVEITFDNHIYVSETPIEITVRETDGAFYSYEAGYGRVETKDGVWHAAGRIRTRFGSVLEVADDYEWKGTELTVSRKVEVCCTDGHESGFSSAFSVGDREETPLSEYDVFIPGIWYRKNENAVKHAFGSDPSDRHFYIRITRMALPYVELYHPGSKSLLVIKHLSPEPDTGMKETEAGWIADESFQYASLGIRSENGTRLCCLFPGSEGEKNYVDPKAGWAKRGHPLKAGVKHEYSFSIKGGEAGNSYEAMKDIWRYFYRKENPSLIHADMSRVYEDGIRLLDTYCQEYNGVMGLPFWTAVPEGTVCDISFQMGFVGQQTMCAYQLMRYGIRRARPDLVEKGERILDFWVENSTKSSVLPRVWYNAFPDTFKEDYPTYTRTAADGMEGILTGWLLEAANGRQKEEWIAFCIRYADWMTEHQNGDGSWYRAYDAEGKPAHAGKFNTGNVIRFLVNLYWATGRETYRDAALKAGEFCYRNIYLPMQFVGGTADNDNTIDKEAGMIAVYAFLSLYEMAGDSRFLDAARGAADFCETWTYAWNFRVRPYKGNGVFEKAGITGLSLIATGHSHADVMMGYMSFEYYKLWLYTKDPHYLDFGRFVHENTKQTVDWSGKLGHAYPGLVEESGELAMQYHNGLGKWLPWCTIAEIEPLTRFEEKFGKMEPAWIPENSESVADGSREGLILEGKNIRSSWLGAGI